MNHLQPKSISSRDWINHLSNLVHEGLSHARANRLRTLLSSIYSYGIETEILHHNPIKRVELFEEEQNIRETWSLEEAKKFFESLWVTRPKLWLLFQLAYETGIRMGELQALSRDSINLDSGKIHVSRTYSKHTGTILNNTKGRKSRVVPISKFLTEEIMRRFTESEHNLLFTREDGKPIPQEEIRREFQKACKIAGLRRIPFHSLRHTFATNFLIQGGGTLELKKLLGHSRVETTEIYTHLTDKHLTHQISRMHLTNENREIGL